MRKLKFRCYDPDLKQWYEAELSPNLGWEVIEKSSRESKHTTNDNVKDWQQYTGLKDKNGKEIYEGDIMRVRLNYQYRKTTPIDKQRRRKYIVGYRCGIHQQYTTAEYQLHILSEYFDDVGGYCGLSDIDMRDSEVIGNIYEHPELLK